MSFDESNSASEVDIDTWMSEFNKCSTIDELDQMREKYTTSLVDDV